MDLTNFLNKDSKIESLEHIRNDLLLEVYSKCLSAGIDPDTFSCQEYVNYWENLEQLQKTERSRNFLYLFSKRLIDIDQAIEAAKNNG